MHDSLAKSMVFCLGDGFHAGDVTSGLCHLDIWFLQVRGTEVPQAVQVGWCCGGLSVVYVNTIIIKRIFFSAAGRSKVGI